MKQLPRTNTKKHSIRAPAQKPEIAICDENFRQVHRLHRGKMLTLEDYLKQILDLNKLEPKISTLKNVNIQKNQSISYKSDLDEEDFDV